MDTFVELLCPECRKHWERDPNELPEPTERFVCPDCGAERDVSEFTRTETDFEVLERIQGMRDGAQPEVDTGDRTTPDLPDEER